MPIKLTPQKVYRTDSDRQPIWWHRHGETATFHVGPEVVRRDQWVQIAGERAIRQFIEFMQYAKDGTRWQTIDHTAYLKMICVWNQDGMGDQRLGIIIRPDTAEPDPPVSDWFTPEQVQGALIWFTDPKVETMPPPEEAVDIRVHPLEMENARLAQRIKELEGLVALLRGHGRKRTRKTEHGTTAKSDDGQGIARPRSQDDSTADR